METLQVEVSWGMDPRCTKVRGVESCWSIGAEQDIRMEFSSEPDIGFYRRSDNREPSTWRIMVAEGGKGGPKTAPWIRRGRNQVPGP